MKMISLIFFLFLLCAAGGTYAQGPVVPIVELKFRGLMGGVQNGKWIAPTKVAPGMRPETEFVLVGWNGVEEGGVTMGKKLEKEAWCEDFVRFEFELKQEHGVAIGSKAKWNPMPRMLKSIDLNNPTYKAVVGNFLRKKGIARPVVQIRQAYRIDLEGDGVDEVILSATYYKNGLSSSAAVGDYSIVMLRKVTGKTVTDHLLEGDFILKKVEFGAPTENYVSAIADLNGDGKMEIALHGFYYEGEFASAFEMKNGRPVKIKEFDIGCGV
jgi:hypothetical protein